MQATGNHVLVEEIIQEETPGGIVLVNSDNVNPKQGKVVSVGSAVYEDIRAGSVVLYGSRTPAISSFDGSDNKYWVVHKDEVLVVL